MDSNKRENGESILTKKKAAFKFTKYLQYGQSELSRLSTDAIHTPSTIAPDSRQCQYTSVLGSPVEDDGKQRFNFHVYNQHHCSQKYFDKSNKVKDIKALEQIKQMIYENEKLKVKINQKQKIIDNLTHSKEFTKIKPRIEIPDLIISQRNSKSVLQQSEKHYTNEEYGHCFEKQFISQNLKRSMINNKLPHIESKQCSPVRDDCMFTFANNFFPREQSQSPKRINMMKAFPQLHLQRKFFT